MQVWQRLANDAPVDVSEYLRNGESWDAFWPSLAGAYAGVSIEIHIYFRAGFVKGGVAGDFCAVFNRTPLQNLDVVVARSDEAEGRRGEKDEMGQSMLIHVVKLVESPKGVGLGEPIPSRVRLQPLDDCFRTFVDAREHLLKFRSVSLDLDRKTGVRFDVAGHRSSLVTGDGEFEDKVVEGTAEVVEAVSDNETKVRGRRTEHFDPKYLLTAISIGLGPGSVRVCLEPGSDFGFKAVQVIERSVESPFVVESHD